MRHDPAFAAALAAARAAADRDACLDARFATGLLLLLAVLAVTLFAPALAAAVRGLLTPGGLL